LLNLMNFVSTPVRAAVLGLLAPVSLCVSMSAVAQTATLKETVVTANRYEQDAQSAPFAVSVLTRESILASGAIDANDALRRLLGVPARTDLTGGKNHTLDLRGFGATASQNIVVIVDGIRISENEDASPRLSSISAEMIESIEVVRGGSSVQWGEGASAGLVNVVLKKNTTPGLSGNASANVESFNGKDTQAVIRLGGAQANFDAQMRSNSTNAFRDNNANRQDTASVGMSGKSGAFDYRFRVTSEDQAMRLPGPLTIAEFGVDPRKASTPSDYSAYAETRSVIGLGWQGNNVKLSIDAGTRDKSASFNYISQARLGQSQSRSYQISPKITWHTSVFNSAVTVVAGQDFNRWSYTGVDNFGSNEQAFQFNEATYLSGDVSLPTGTRFVGGVRQETVNKRAEDVVNFVSYNRSDSLNAWDWGVNQAVSNGLNTYLRSAKSYRLPNVDENRYLGSALRPQNSRDLEVGVNWQINPSSTLLARWFEQKTIDEIAFNALDPSCLPFGCNTNLDPTRRRGVELESRTKWNHRFSSQVVVQSVDARFTDGAYTDRLIPSVSSLSGAVRLGWNIDAHQSLNVGAQFLGAAKVTNDVANVCASNIPDRSLYDARYVWKDKQVEWSLAAINLTDQASFSNATTNATCTRFNVYPDPGRTFRAGFKYNF
jgi:iron complex outermembrane receptor protein